MSDPEPAENDQGDLDRGETFQDSGPDEPDHSKLYRVFRYLVENSMLIVVGLGGALFVVAAVIGYEIPRNGRIIGLSFLISLFTVGRPTANKAKGWLWDPNLIWIVDVETKETAKGGIFNVPSQRFREWTVENGSLDWVTPNLAFGKRVDLAQQTVDGCWRGTLSDRELMRALQAVEECRGQLEKDAKRGFVIESQAFAIVRNATRKAVLNIVSTFERGTLPDEGKGLGEEIDAALEQFDLERKIRVDEEDESPESDVPGITLDGDLLEQAAQTDPGGAAADD